MTYIPKKSEYERRRNALIPQAVCYADSLHPEPKDVSAGKRGKDRNRIVAEWENAWNRAFHGEMERLWKLGK